jgi:cell division transport system ATP-binding protein
MIAFDHVSLRYPTGLAALNELSFEVNAGELVFVTGHSGAGKSSLLKLIGLIDRPTSGAVRVGGHALENIGARQLAFYRRQIGVVYQDHRLLTDRSVFDNVALPLQIAGFRPPELGQRVRAALDLVNLLEKENLSPLALSGGEQQRVGIARAIVTRPPILIADEPTGNLDPKLAEEIMALFVSFQQVGSCVVIASHDLNLIKHWRKRTLVLRSGQLIDDFRPD